MPYFQKSVCIVLLAFSLCESYTLPADEIDAVARLSKELNKLQMSDYSEDLLKMEIAKNPPDADMLRIQLSMTYFIMNKADEAEEIISSIPVTGKFYSDSRRVLGLEAFRKGKNDEAIKYLEEYFAKATTGIPSSQSGRDDFTEAVQYLSHIYAKIGQVEKAAAAMKYLDLLLKTEDGQISGSDKVRSKRESILLQIQAKLDAVEQQFNTGQKDWENTVNDSLKMIDELMWEHPDSTVLFAYIEKARSLYFIGRYDDALKELESPVRTEFFDAFDQVYKEEGAIGSAPSPMALFWAGKIYVAKAGKVPDDEEKIKFLGKALACFYKIADKYDSFTRFPDVVKLFIETKRSLEQLGKEITIPKNMEDKFKQSGSTLPPEAEKYFADAKYDLALPYYQSVIVKSRKSKDAPDILARLAYCYVQTDQLLEALALARYLAAYYPKYANTPLTLSQVGESLWSKKQVDEAISAYEDYLDNCPAGQYAAAFAARVANTYYEKAKEMAKLTGKMPQGAEKIEKNIRVREAFAAAIPKFQRIVKDYPQSEYGPEAFYLLAWCYTNAKDFKKGAETFLEYCDFDSKSVKPDLENIADAKLRAADNYFQFASSLGKEARAIREKAQTALSVKSDEEHKPEGEKTEEEVDEKIEKTPAETLETPTSTPVDEKKNAGDSPEKMLAKANDLEKDATKYYAESIRHLLELLDTLRNKGGRLESDKSERILAVIENGTILLGYVYDGAGDREKACKVFTEFLKDYSKSIQMPAVMFHLGKLYRQMGKPDLAAQVLEKLFTNFPESKEGRMSLPSLGRSMYDIEKYDKAIESFNKILTQKMGLSIPVMRWAAEKLSDCGGTHPKEGAEIASRIAGQLLGMLEKPVYADWLPKAKVLKARENPEEEKKMLVVLREKVLFDAANASFWSEDYKGAVRLLDDLLKKGQTYDPKNETPYYIDGRTLRAMAYRKIENYKDAIRDYTDISMAAMTSKKSSLYFKAQCLCGDTYMEQPDYVQACGVFSTTAMLNPQEKNPDVPEQEMKEQSEWIEYAIYKSVMCTDKLNMAKEKESLIGKYRKYFPSGKFITKIDKLSTTSAPADVDDNNDKTEKNK